MEKAGGKSNHDTNFSLALGKILNQSFWKTFILKKLKPERVKFSVPLKNF